MNRDQDPETYTYAAYNSAPAGLAADPHDESRWYSLLRAEPLIGGLELGFTDTLHATGVAHLASLLDETWSSTVTTIPGTLAAIRSGQPYGLASTSLEHRRRAVDAVAHLLDEIRQLQAIRGPGSIRAVQLHSAPQAASGASSAALFVDSLTEIASWEWGDVTLSVEHADALVAGHEAAKGYLPLAVEVEAADEAGMRSGRVIRHSINWGRSAIETHSAEGPVDHLRALVAADALCGLMFSGASGTNTSYSAPWQDLHLAIDTAEPASILTSDAIRDCLRAVDDRPLAFLGVKVGAQGSPESLEQRLAPGLATLRALHAVRHETTAARGVRS